MILSIRRCALLLVSLGAAACGNHSVPSGPPNFTGLWQVADTNLTIKPEDDPTLLTDEGLRRKRESAANFDAERDSADAFCVPHGMPWIMLSRARDYLTDIYQTKDRITLLLEGMDVHRLVRFDQGLVPDTFQPSTNGYSLGHWEADTLVIETTHLRATNPAGRYQRSEQMKVTERWRLINHPKFGRALELQVEALDPVLYRHVGRGYQLYVAAPPGSVLNAYGCAESRFDDHINELRKKPGHEN